MNKQQTFEEFARDKLELLRKTSFYGGRPLTDAENVRVQTIEDLLEEYDQKISRGRLRKSYIPTAGESSGLQPRYYI